jgi:type II secretory pathway component GspD/PulD (secretin)
VKAKSVLFFFGMLVLASQHLGSSCWAAAPIEHIRFSDGALTVSVRKATLQQVLDRLTEETGIEFVCDRASSHKEISVSFQSLPTEKAIATLLSGFDRLIFYGPHGTVTKVIVLGERGPQAPTHGLEASAAGERRPQAPTLGLQAPTVGQRDGTGRSSKEEMMIAPAPSTMKITESPVEMEITDQNHETMKIMDVPAEMKID